MHKLTFSEFCKELDKSGISPSNRPLSEWYAEYFESPKEDIRDYINLVLINFDIPD